MRSSIFENGKSNQMAIGVNLIYFLYLVDTHTISLPFGSTAVTIVNTMKKGNCVAVFKSYKTKSEFENFNVQIGSRLRFKVRQTYIIYCPHIIENYIRST